MSELQAGDDWSLGGRQLLCLARALLGKSKVVVLDEASASLDHESDLRVHNALLLFSSGGGGNGGSPSIAAGCSSSSARGCTVLCIAHRLHTIITADKVVVMDAGRVVEEGPPAELLRLGSEGHFDALVRATGPATSRQLRKTAAAAAAGGR